MLMLMKCNALKETKHLRCYTVETDVFVFTEPSSTSMLHILLNFSTDALELTLSQGCLPRGNVFV
jgi:hypothetical protein